MRLLADLDQRLLEDAFGHRFTTKSHGYGSDSVRPFEYVRHGEDDIEFGGGFDEFDDARL